MPPVGGVLRVKVLLAFGGVGAATAAAFGLITGSVWEALGLPRVGLMGAGILCALAALADALRAPVLCTRRQVPVEWGRLLPPITVAVLYGGRLGVGPLTILNSWLWWAGAIIGASHGPWKSLTVGALFGGVRTGLTALAGLRRAAAHPSE